MEVILSEQMDWNDITAVLPAVQGSSEFRNTVKSSLNEDPSGTYHYLYAMLLLDEGDIRQALATFKIIPVERIPTEFLYLPFRLQSEINPDEPNPYWDRLFRERETVSLPALIRARVSVMGGNEKDGLEAYSQTDPRDWRQIDVRLFRQLDLHAGLQSETRILLKAALSGKRVPETLRDDIVRIIFPKPMEFVQSQQLDVLRERLVSDPELAGKVARASGELLNIQKLFLEKSYGEILRRYGGLDPLDQADRVVVILFLSAIRNSDTEQAVRWSQELYRRYPTGEMKLWIESIKSPST